jgi:hypothetical protein
MRALVLLFLVGCMPPIARTADNAIDLRYRMRTTDASTATSVYRAVGARSLGVKSRCKMVPTDSEMFASRTRDCGATRAWYWGVSRVLLERGASRKFMRPIELDGRLRWIDLAEPCR